MRIIYSQRDGENYLPRDEFRKITKSISRTARNSKLLVKIFFYKRKHLICKKCGWISNKKEIKKEWFVFRESKDRIRAWSKKKYIPEELLDKIEIILPGVCWYCGNEEFKEDWAGKGAEGNFRSFVDHCFYNSEEKYFKQGKRGVITLKLWPNVKPEEVFNLFAHEFYHWRQANIVHYGRGKYSERKATKWQKKMLKKYYPEYFKKRFGEKI
jgi:hypothetical protein